MTSNPSAGEPRRRTPTSAVALLLVVCGALFVEGLDVAMLNVAVPTIAADLDLDEGHAHWIISAYVLGYAGFLLLGGRASDRFGRRRVFLAAITVFALLSALGGFAVESWMLVASRFLTGVAAGFMTPAGFGLVTTSFSEGRARNRALAVYGAVGGGGFVLGNLVGGLLTTIGWRWLFFAPAAVVAVLLVVGATAIPRDPPTDGRTPFDLLGAVTATGGMIALVFAIVTLGEEGPSAAGLASLALGAALIALFAVVESRVRDPLLPPRLLGHGNLTPASLAGLCFMAAYFGFQFLLTLFLQEQLGWTPLETGLAFAVMGADLVLAPIAAPLLARRLGNPAVLVLGFVAVLGSIALALPIDGTWTFADLLPSLLLTAVAFALVYGPLAATATEGLAAGEHGVAGGVLHTAFQFGAAVGLAAVTVVLVGGGTSSPGVDDFRRALTVPVVIGLGALAAGTWALVRSRRRRTPDGRPGSPGRP